MNERAVEHLIQPSVLFYEPEKWNAPFSAGILQYSRVTTCRFLKRNINVDVNIIISEIPSFRDLVFPESLFKHFKMGLRHIHE